MKTNSSYYWGKKPFLVLIIVISVLTGHLAVHIFPQHVAFNEDNIPFFLHVNLTQSQSHDPEQLLAHLPFMLFAKRLSPHQPSVPPHHNTVSSTAQTTPSQCLLSLDAAAPVHVAQPAQPIPAAAQPHSPSNFNHSMLPPHRPNHLHPFSPAPVVLLTFLPTLIPWSHGQRKVWGFQPKGSYYLYSLSSFSGPCVCVCV